MSYIKEICIAGNTIEVRKYFTIAMRREYAKRQKRDNGTRETQERTNDRNAERTLTRTMNTNFKEGDYHVVMDYRLEDRPEGFDEMRENFRAFYRRLRYRCKKLGIVLKYIHVMERGTKGARHHHIVMNGIPPKLIRECWTKGRIHINLLDDTGQYRKLAQYLLKYTRDAVKNGELKHRWDPSRNLKKPIIKKEVVSRRYFQLTPHIEDGYYLDKDSVEVWVDANGNKQFNYTMIRRDTS